MNVCFCHMSDNEKRLLISLLKNARSELQDVIKDASLPVNDLTAHSLFQIMSHQMLHSNIGIFDSTIKYVISGRCVCKN